MLKDMTKHVTYPTPRRTLRYEDRSLRFFIHRSTGRAGHLNVGKSHFFRLALSSPLKNLVGSTISSAQFKWGDAPG
jgi:hypothetical protein